MDVDESSREIGAILLRLTERVAVHLPQHAAAIRGDLIGVKLTLDRWHRVQATCLSLSASVPGNGLTGPEYEAKAIPLRFVAVTQMICRAKFGMARDNPNELADAALRLAREIETDAGETHKTEEG